MNGADHIDALLRNHYARAADTGASEVQISGILHAVADTRQRRIGGWRLSSPSRRTGDAAARTSMRLLGLAGLLLVLAAVAGGVGSGLLPAPDPMPRTYEGVFEPVGSLPEGTWPTNLIALPDGDALVIGYAGGDYEVGDDLFRFDGQTGAFAGVGRLALHRSGPAAVLLESGSVLVVGSTTGETSWPAGPADGYRAELVDPGTGTSRLIGPTVHPHAYGHAATRLLDGRVLISDGNPELYDPVTETFVGTGPMADPFRNGHSAVLLLDGRVLVVGGTEDVTLAAEVFDPTSETFATTGPVAFLPAWGNTAVLLADGRVLVVGGETTGEAQIFDPESDTWSATGPLPGDRGWHSGAALQDGRVLVAGGYVQDAVEEADDAFLFDPGSGAFAATTSMTTQRVDPFVETLADGRVLIVGNMCRNPGCYGLGDDAWIRGGSAEIFR